MVIQKSYISLVVDLKQHYIRIMLTVRNVLARKVCLAASEIVDACEDRKGGNTAIRIVNFKVTRRISG